MSDPKGNAAALAGARGAGSDPRESSYRESTVPRVDLGNLTHGEIATAKLLHEQGIPWWLACLFVAWRRQFPKTHVGPLGTRMLAEAVLAGCARRRGGGR